MQFPAKSIRAERLQEKARITHDESSRQNILLALRVRLLLVSCAGLSRTWELHIARLRDWRYSWSLPLARPFFSPHSHAWTLGWPWALSHALAISSSKKLAYTILAGCAVFCNIRDAARTHLSMHAELQCSVHVKDKQRLRARGMQPMFCLAKRCSRVHACEGVFRAARVMLSRQVKSKFCRFPAWHACRSFFSIVSLGFWGIQL